MSTVLLSFLAGFTLNFMPCVLPILLVKIYDIMKYAQDGKDKIRLKLVLISTTFGILFVFLFFSFVDILFKYTGKTFNFGFHFQNQYFLILVIFLLFLFLLNLLDVFHINYSSRLTGYFQKGYEKSKALNKGIFIENFITAIFMVVFATPCSAPILGTVAAFLLVGDNVSIICNFLAMGFGMSIPFLLLSIYPDLLGFLKNRSSSLKFIQKIVGLFIFLTILWLLYILRLNIGIKAVITLILFMIALVAQFIFLKNPIHNLIMVVIIIVPGIIFPIAMFKEEEAIKMGNSIWLNGASFEEIHDWIQKDKIVFVNITAKWCMICNINNITVFSKYDVLDFLRSSDIIPVKIDITKNNDKAEEFYGDSNTIYVPKYIIFSKKHTEGCSFSGQLDKRSFYKKLNKCL